MNTDDGKTEETTDPGAHAAAPATSGNTASAADATAADEGPPTTVSLDVVTAMHQRLVQARGQLRDLDQRSASFRADVDAIGKMLRDEVLPQINDLHATVTEHADLLDGLGQVIEQLGAKVAPLRRGEVERRLPEAPGNTASSSPPDLEATALEQPGAFQAGKVTPVGPPIDPSKVLTELRVDPSKVGKQVVQLPSGGELEINVRRPPAAPAPAGGGVLRDGRRTTGGTRRG